MQMTEEQFKLMKQWIDSLIAEDYAVRLRAESRFRNSVGLHQHDDLSGPWECED